MHNRRKQSRIAKKQKTVQGSFSIRKTPLLISLLRSCTLQQHQANLLFLKARPLSKAGVCSSRSNYRNLRIITRVRDTAQFANHSSLRDELAAASVRSSNDASVANSIAHSAIQIPQRFISKSHSADESDVTWN